MGCNTESYDIDVQCPLRNMETLSQDGVRGFVCSGISGEGFSDFIIQCDAETVQNIDSVWICTTTDGKSVRIKNKATLP